MSQLNRMREMQRAAQVGAIKRWRERSGEREKNRREITIGGPGAADSPTRQMRYKAREAAFERARQLRTSGRLSLGLERKIGPTLDWTPFAPTEGARKAGRPVARIVELGGTGIEPAGFATCFLVTPRLLMTNHHVFPSKADAVGIGANFLYEETDRGVSRGVIFEIDADTFYLADERLDLAIVAVKPRSPEGHAIDEFGTVALVEATPKILMGHRINIIQHPEGQPKKYAVTNNRLLDLLDAGYLHYETDTLEGSSGAPVFSQDWQLVGLHHAGIPEMIGDKVVSVDGGIWVEGMPDDRVKWIANEATRVSAIVKYLGGVRMDDPARQKLLTELLETTADPIDELAQEAMTLAPPPSSIQRLASGAANNSFNMTGPVTIHVYAPGPTAVTPPTVIDVKPQAVVAPEKVIRFDPDYKKRGGYDPFFLVPGDAAFEVPVPSVHSSRDHEILKDKKGNILVLKYHHFELVMNEQRYLQMWSAVNVEYDPEFKSTRDRKEFGSDKWIPDPRIPAELQLMDAEFYKPAGNIDRGHIVRREDNAWGESEQDIEFANSDTFHWPNCTPQHEAFNQSAPGRNDPTYIGMKGLWGDFENHIQSSLHGEDTRACILAGPILDSSDPSKDFGFGSIQYPLRFWKVIAVPVVEDGQRKLTVFGFMLSQRDVVKKFGIEVFRPGRFKKYQVSLAKITKETGVEFDGGLHAADVMKGKDEEHAIVDGHEILGLRRRPVDATEPATGAAAPGKPPNGGAKPRRKGGSGVAA